MKIYKKNHTIDKYKKGSKLILKYNALNLVSLASTLVEQMATNSPVRNVFCKLRSSRRFAERPINIYVCCFEGHTIADGMTWRNHQVNGTNNYEAEIEITKISNILNHYSINWHINKLTDRPSYLNIVAIV